MQGHARTPSRRSTSERKTTQAGREAPQSLHCASCGGEHSKNTLVSFQECHANAENVVNWDILPKYVGHLQQQ